MGNIKKENSCPERKPTGPRFAVRSLNTMYSPPERPRAVKRPLELAPLSLSPIIQPSRAYGDHESRAAPESQGLSTPRMVLNGVGGAFSALADTMTHAVSYLPSLASSNPSPRKTELDPEDLTPREPSPEIP